MTTINDLRGFCYPLTPGGVSSLVGDLPWHYATEYRHYCLSHRSGGDCRLSARAPRACARAGPRLCRLQPMVVPVGQPAGYGFHQSRAHAVSGVCDLGWMFVPRHRGAALSADLGEQRFHPGPGLVYGVSQEVGADLSDGISSPESPDAAFRPRGQDERLCLCAWGAID